MYNLAVYLLITLCIILTLVAILGAGYLYKFLKKEVFDDLLDTIKRQKDQTWRNSYYAACDKGEMWRDRFYKFGVSPDAADHILYSKVEWRDELNECGNHEIMIKLEIEPEEKDEHK